MTLRDDVLDDYAELAREYVLTRDAALLAFERVEVLEQELAEADAVIDRMARPWSPAALEVACPS